MNINDIEVTKAVRKKYYDFATRDQISVYDIEGAKAKARHQEKQRLG